MLDRGTLEIKIIDSPHVQRNPSIILGPFTVDRDASPTDWAEFVMEYFGIKHVRLLIYQHQHCSRGVYRHSKVRVELTVGVSSSLILSLDFSW